MVQRGGRLDQHLDGQMDRLGYCSHWEESYVSTIVHLSLTLPASRLLSCAGRLQLERSHNK